MRIKLNSVFVDDQDKALKFYTDVLGFVKKRDMPAGKFRWLTVVPPEDPDSTELVLEPDDNPAAKAFKKSLYEQGIPLTAFAVDDIQNEYKKMKKLGVIFRIHPTKMGPTTMAVFDDTCGNLIQIYQAEHVTIPVKKLFDEYEKAFNALEVEKQVPFFAEHFISAGPRGSIAQGRDEFAKMAGKAAEFYRNIGQTSARIITMSDTSISTEYSMVRVRWGVTFRKTKDKLIEFDITYFIQKTGPEPKIIMFIAHEDEQKAMKQLGILG